MWFSSSSMAKEIFPSAVNRDYKIIQEEIFVFLGASVSSQKGMLCWYSIDGPEVPEVYIHIVQNENINLYPQCYTLYYTTFYMYRRYIV